MMLSALVVLCLAGLASARRSCPTFFGAHETSMLNYPTPRFDISFNQDTRMVKIVVETVYDPYAALVIDFTPYVPSRQSLSQVGKCENRDENLTDKWSWRPDYYSACQLGDDKAYETERGYEYYPLQGHNWTMTNRDCNLVEYTYESTLDDLMNNCSSSVMGLREVDGKLEYYGNVYVTYVRPDRDYDYECIIHVANSTNCNVSTVYDSQQISFKLVDTVTTANTCSCTDNTKIQMTSNLSWQSDCVNVNVLTDVGNPSDKGLLCSMESKCDNELLTTTNSKKECDCASHCSKSTFCSSANASSCTQQWAIQSNGTYYPGDIHNSQYDVTWKINNCKGYNSSTDTSCPNPPEVTCAGRIVTQENIVGSYEYSQPIRPFAALLLRQPPNDKFDYSFSNKDLKVWVRVSPLVRTRANVYRIEYCEADKNGDSCTGNWNTLKTWNEGTIAINEYVETSVVLTDPKNKVYLFRAVSDKENSGATTLILDTHNTGRVAPIPTNYVAVDKTFCDGNYEDDGQSDGFNLDDMDMKKILKIAGAILTALTVV